MKAFTTTNSSSDQVIEKMSNIVVQVRARIISAADVWNIQRNKKSRVQRRFAL